MTDMIRAVAAGLLVVTVLLMGVAIMDSLTASQDGIRLTADETVLLGNTGEAVTVGQGAAEGYDEQVVDSAGHAVNLTGASDSYIETEQAVTVAEDDTFTVAVGARVDDGAASQNMTVVSVDGRLIISYNGSTSQWEAWYYEESGRDSYSVNVSAPDQPQSFKYIIVTANATDLAIYRNTTRGSTANLSQSNLTDAPVSTTNFDGRLDELRTFNDSLNSSVRSSLVTDPVSPQPNTNRTARVMFDEPNRAAQRLFFAAGDVTTSNATFDDGFAGDVLSEGTDYAWNVVGPTITPLAGGSLDGAPVAYVDYQREDALADVLRGWSDLVQLAALLPMLIVAWLIIRLSP